MLRCLGWCCVVLHARGIVGKMLLPLRKRRRGPSVRAGGGGLALALLA